MKHSSMLIFISPIPWGFHNKQMETQASKFSRKHNVLFIDFTRIKRISLRTILSSETHRRHYAAFLHQLTDHRKRLIADPPFLVFAHQERHRSFAFINNLCVLIQLLMYVAISTGVSSVILLWASTTEFPGILRGLPFSRWYYDYFDRFADFSDAGNSKRFLDNESWLLKHAKNIFVSSKFYNDLAVKIAPELRFTGKLVSVSAGYVLRNFLALSPKRFRKKIIIGYYGALSERLDYSLILKIAKSNPEMMFIFFGPLFEYGQWLSPIKKISPEIFISKLKELKNVKVLPYSSEAIQQRSIVNQFTIGWIPYDTNIYFNEYSTPTKFYEYCAAGLPILSTEIPTVAEQRDLSYCIATADNFKAAVKACLQSNSLRSIKKRKIFALQNDVDKKIAIVEKYLYNENIYSNETTYA